jgi:3'(2'), 5'-bisphosphate nucleotidase
VARPRPAHGRPSRYADAMPLPPADTLRHALVDAAREAGRAILEIYRQDFDVSYKDDATPLTEADLAAHRILRRRLATLAPGVPYLSEEGETTPFETRREWGTLWVVDPLDGTREFVARRDDFTVNIALVVAGRSVLGVVHAPVFDLTYVGGDGVGALRLEGDGPAEPIRVRPPEGRELKVVASRSHARGATHAFLEGLRDEHDLDVVARGSALKACFVADGSAHLYPRLGTTSEWDTAASQAIVEAAGGVLRAMGTNAPLRYNKPDLRNPPFYAAYGEGAPHP